MTITTQRNRRLSAVPDPEQIDRQLRAWGGWVDLDDYLTRERLSQHIFANLWPDGDATTVEHLVNAIRGLTDAQVHYDYTDGLVTLKAAALLPLLNIRSWAQGLR